MALSCPHIVIAPLMRRASPPTPSLPISSDFLQVADWFMGSNCPRDSSISMVSSQLPFPPTPTDRALTATANWRKRSTHTCSLKWQETSQLAYASGKVDYRYTLTYIWSIHFHVVCGVFLCFTTCLVKLSSSSNILLADCVKIMLNEV